MKYQSRFLSLAQQGRNKFKHYFLSILVIFGFLVGLSIILALFGLALGIPLENFRIEDQSLEIQLFFVILACSGLCSSLFFVTATIHKRHPITLIDTQESIRFRRILVGFAIWFLIRIVVSAILYLFYPENYALSDSIGKSIIFIPVALVLSFAMSVLYFVLFSYFLQGMNSIVKNQIILISIISFIITILAEFNRFNINYFISGFMFQIFLLFLIIQEDGLELVAGLYMAQSFYQLSFLGTNTDNNTPFSRFPSLLIAKLPPEFLWIPIFLAQIGLFYYIIFVRKNKRRKMEDDRI